MTPPKIKGFSPCFVNRDKFYQWIEIILSVLILIVLLFFSYTELFLKPKLGFSINWKTGIITRVDPVAKEYLQEDDQVLWINGIQPQNINTPIRENPLIQTEVGGIFDLILIRDGEEIQVFYPKPPQDEQPLLEIISGDWILPYPFFAAGIITALFIRPKTKTRLLLILFFYAFALWISAGLISPTGYWGSITIMRVFIWFNLPVAFQLHWRFPIPFKFSKKWGNFTAYAAVLIPILLEIFSSNQGDQYLMAFLFTLLSSLTMLIIKYFRFKAHRKLLRWILLGYLLAVFPLVLMVISMLIGSVPLKGNIALMGLTAIPGFYYFTGYRIHMKRENPQINLAQRIFITGILLTFLINLIFQFFPLSNINSFLYNTILMLMIQFVSLTGFGALLIMPALADDQVNLYETESYTLRLSANRAAAFIIFMILISPIIFTLTVLTRNVINSQLGSIFLTTIICLSITTLSVLIYDHYQKLFDRVVLGIHRVPEELIRSYAHTISTSLERDSLAALLKDEIMPSLLIRESVLFYIQDDHQVMTLFRTGLTTTQVERVQDAVSGMMAHSNQEKHLDNIKTDFSWVRVVFPLKIKEKIMGVWCVGRKDPNEIYDQDFIKDLNSLANQTTLALLNIHQAELLIELYNANVNRQEEEKANLARDFHDVLLPSIGYLVELQSSHCSTAEFEQAVQRINNMIRDVMSGLRPATLDMGLAIALDELADDPVAQIGGDINIQTRMLMPEPVAYDKQAELHLFRMVQQASQNALEHARAKEIIIHGTLLPDSLDLHVDDDGIGFHMNSMPNLSTLIANKHFGLANIFERAKIINAEVRINSQINHGTSLHIFWIPQNLQK